MRTQEQADHLRRDGFALSNRVYEVRSGSLSYGTALPGSDLDLRGVFVAPPEFALGLNPLDHVKGDGEDTVYTGLAKFFGQCAEGAINLVELLYVRPEDVTYRSEVIEPFLAERERFLTVDMVHKTLGFMTGMKRRAERLLQTSDTEQAAKERPILHKQVMHAVRCGRMVAECIATNSLEVYRPDRAELLLIRQGLVPVEHSMAEIDGLIHVIEMDHAKAGWPRHADREFLSGLCVRATFRHWRARRWL